MSWVAGAGGCSRPRDWLKSHVPEDIGVEAGTAVTQARLEEVDEHRKAFRSQTIASVALLEDANPCLLLRLDSQFTDHTRHRWTSPADSKADCHAEET